MRGSVDMNFLFTLGEVQRQRSGSKERDERGNQVDMERFAPAGHEIEIGEIRHLRLAGRDRALDFRRLEQRRRGMHGDLHLAAG